MGRFRGLLLLAVLLPPTPPVAAGSGAARASRGAVHCALTQRRSRVVAGVVTAPHAQQHLVVQYSLSGARKRTGR